MREIRLWRGGPHTERLSGFARRLLWRELFPIRRHIMAAVALLFVVGTVALVLNERLPFPSPGEGILLDPTDWAMLFHRDPPLPARPDMRTPGPSVGGSSFVQPPLAILLYRAHTGDTMSGIATKLGMDIGLRCTGCGRSVRLLRAEFDRRFRGFVRRAGEECADS